MDMATGLMLTAAALTQGVESPRGRVAAFDSVQAPQMKEWLSTMGNMVLASTQLLERQEADNQGPDASTIYRGMRRLAGKQERGEY